jgi:hypothetical protein
VADLAPVPPDHARHDRLLVAAEVDRAADRGGPLAKGRALLAACADCAGLHADLLALAAALPSAAAPRRTRDFTLTAADADRLRPRGLRRWLAQVGSPRDTLTRPLAIGFTTLGLAGLLVTTAPAVASLGSAGGAAAASPGPTDAEIRLEMSTAPSMAPGFQQQSGGGTTSEAPMPAPPDVVATTTAGDAARLPVVVLSGSFLALGGGLFAVRRRARMR